jgi:hypothetical protein
LTIREVVDKYMSNDALDIKLTNTVEKKNSLTQISTTNEKKFNLIKSPNSKNSKNVSLVLSSKNMVNVKTKKATSQERKTESA